MIQNDLHLTEAFAGLTRNLTKVHLGQLVAGLARQRFRGKAFDAVDPLVQEDFDRVIAEAIHIG